MNKCICHFRTTFFWKDILPGHETAGFSGNLAQEGIFFVNGSLQRGFFKFSQMDLSLES